MKLVIIDPAKHRIETAVFNKISALSKYKCEYHVPQFSDSIFHIDHSDISAMIILGSDFDVSDYLPWQDKLIEEIMWCHQNNTPLLGICYGHQLIAHTFGCQLGYYFKDQKKFKGSRSIQLFSNEIWKKQEFDMQYSHRQIVSTLSSQMKAIGVSSTHQFEALKHKSSEVFTFQGHPEQSLSNNISYKDNYWIFSQFIDYACNTQLRNQDQEL